MGPLSPSLEEAGRIQYHLVAEQEVPMHVNRGSSFFMRIWGVTLMLL